MKLPFERRRLTNIGSYVLAGVALLGLLTLALAPLSRSLVEQWSRRDVESRARLAAHSIEGPLSRAVIDNDRARLTDIMAAVTQDDRIVAVALCGDARRPYAATAGLPRAFACDRVARAEGESFSDIDYGE